MAVLPRLALAGLAVAMAASVPAVASASDRVPRPKYRAVEVNGVAMAQVLPTHMFGGEFKFALGNETFHARLGAVVVGGRAFDVGPGKIGNALEYGELDLCVAKSVQRHRVRMCFGGNGGAMQHRWIGFGNPGRKVSPWASGTLKGDYTFAINNRWGVIAGAGVIVPIVGPSFRGTDEFGRKSELIFPGPVGGMLTIGARFRVL